MDASMLSGVQLGNAQDGSPRLVSECAYLPASQTDPILSYLHGRGAKSEDLSELSEDGRLRRDAIECLADRLDSDFLRDMLDEDVWYDKVVEILPSEWMPIYDVEVEEHHTLVANDIIASNCAPPFRQSEFDIMYGKGISREGSLLDVAVDIGIVKKSGAWFTYDGEQLGQGRENAKTFLSDSPELMMEISEKIKQHYGLGDTEVDLTTEEGDEDDAPIGLSVVNDAD
jgi:recombination protein RecA